MIDAGGFLAALHAENIRFFAGVPDSTLKSFSWALENEVPAHRHLVAANEGSAVALAAGHYLATGELACVYMQNSGMGNAANPLISLNAPEVYGIPLLLIVGWRGEIRDGMALHDEPQHALQGRITLTMLDCLEIEHRVLGPGERDVTGLIRDLAASARLKSRPVSLVVRRGVLDGDVPRRKGTHPLARSREAALIEVLAALPPDIPCVATTGKVGRELYEYRRGSGGNPHHDFLTVGSMGHASQIAAGIALARPAQRIACIDGDGAMIMHMGGLVTSAALPNFLHVVLNNGAHESTGGAATRGFAIDMPGIARASGYAFAARIDDHDEIAPILIEALSTKGSVFVEIRASARSRSDLGRPGSDLVSAKRVFMSRLAGGPET